MLGTAANALPGAIASPVEVLQPYPGAAEKLSFCQYVSRLGHPGRRLCTNRGAADEPKRGSARLMGQGSWGATHAALFGISRRLRRRGFRHRDLPRWSGSLVHHRCAVGRADRANGEPDAQERPYAGRFDQKPQCGERSGRNECPAGARAQAQTARWLRAGGERDRTLAVGADRRPLRILSISGRSPSRTSQVFAPRAAAPLPRAHLAVGPKARRRSCRAPPRRSTEPSKYQRLIEGDGQWRPRDWLLAHCRPDGDGDPRSPSASLRLEITVGPRSEPAARQAVPSE